MSFDSCSDLCSLVVPGSGLLHRVASLISFDFMCRRLRSGCYRSGNHATRDPVHVFGCLLLGMVCSVSSISIIRHAHCSVSFGCFLKLAPRRAGLVGPDSLAGFHQLHLGSVSLLSLLVGGAISVTVRTNILGSEAVVISTARARSHSGPVDTTGDLRCCYGTMVGIIGSMSSDVRLPRLPGRGGCSSVVATTGAVITAMRTSTTTTGVPTIGRHLGVLGRAVSSTRAQNMVSGSTSTHAKRGATRSSFFNCGARVTVDSREVVATTAIASNRGNSKRRLPRLVGGARRTKVRISSVMTSGTCSDGRGLGVTGRGGVHLSTHLDSMVSNGQAGGLPFRCGGSTSLCIYPTKRLTG